MQATRFAMPPAAGCRHSACRFPPGPEEEPRITGRTTATENPIGLMPFVSVQQAGVSIFRRDGNLSMFLLLVEDHGGCAGWITTVFLERQRNQYELSMDVQPGIWSRHWSTKAKSPGRMLAGCLCESPAVSISRQERVQYRGLHGNIALFCSVPMVTTTTEGTAFPPPPGGRGSHAVILDDKRKRKVGRYSFTGGARGGLAV